MLAADGAITYEELGSWIDDIPALSYRERSLVLIAGTNSVDSLVTYAAALAHGHTALLVPGDNVANLDLMIGAYDPDVVFAAGLIERREGTVHDLHPELALLMSTSGSTGSPKLVRLSYDNIHSNASSIADYLDIEADDRAITTLPMHYCYGLSVVNSHLLRGAGLVVTDLSVVDECLWELFARHEASSFAGVPYTFDLLDSTRFAERDLPSLRYVTQAGGRLNAARVAGYARLGRERGWDFYSMYGQTEATARMAYLPPTLTESHPHALGVPVPGGAFRLEPVPEASDPGVGELVFTGDNVMMGYADVTADLALGREVTELHTGDLARVDDDGLYEWVGRKSRIAKIFGLRIDLDQVECLLAANGCPARCVAAGDRLQAFVEWHDEPAPARAALTTHCALPSHAIAVERVRTQPRTANGKVDYAALERHAMVLGSSEMTARRPRLGAAVCDVVNLYALLLARPDATAEDSFASLGGDSLSYVELSVRLAEMQVTLPADWHRLPVRELTAAPRLERRRGVRLESSIMLRAVAIMLVLGTHANLWPIPGGAHILLAVVGYNFARFQLSRSRPQRLRHGFTSLLHVVIPSVLWIACVALLLGTYDISTTFLLNGLLGSNSWTVQWQFWFLEAVVWIQVAMIAVLAVPMVHRAQLRSPFGFAMGFVVASVVLRYALVGVEAGATERYTPSIVLWCLALGWAAAVAESNRHRLIVSAAAALALPGFFGDPQREGVILIGVLLLVWVSAVTVPRWFARGAGVLASASLYIYLTHWQVYPYLEDRIPTLAVVASLAVGIAYWRLCETAILRTRRRQYAT